MAELGLSADDDTSFWCHCVLSRPDSAPYWDGMSDPVCSELFDQTMTVMHEIATVNNVPFQPIRMAINCTTPGEVPMSIPHVDHYFPHYNFFIYLSEFTGGNTWLEGHGEIEPDEDMILRLDGDVRHSGCRPTGSNERRIVFVATSGFVPEDRIERRPSERIAKITQFLEEGDHPIMKKAAGQAI